MAWIARIRRILRGPDTNPIEPGALWALYGAGVLLALAVMYVPDARHEPGIRYVLTLSQLWLGIAEAGLYHGYRRRFWLPFGTILVMTSQMLGRYDLATIALAVQFGFLLLIARRGLSARPRAQGKCSSQDAETP